MESAFHTQRLQGWPQCPENPGFPEFQGREVILSHKVYLTLAAGLAVQTTATKPEPAGPSHLRLCELAAGLLPSKAGRVSESLH